MLTYADSKQNASSPTVADAQQHAFSPTALGAAGVAGAAFVTGAVGVAGVAGGGSRAACAQASAVDHGQIVHSGAGAGAVYSFLNRLIEP